MHVHRAEGREEAIENCTVKHRNFLCDFVFIDLEEMENGPLVENPHFWQIRPEVGHPGTANLKTSEG